MSMRKLTKMKEKKRFEAIKNSQGTIAHKLNCETTLSQSVL